MGKLIIHTFITIAYKCCSCGGFDFSSISLFEALHKGRVYHNCRCGKSGFVLTSARYQKREIGLSCIACGKKHKFELNLRDILNGETRVFYCPDTGIQLCFMGNDIQVREKIDDLERELDDMMDTLGYESYFTNTRVMYDSINRIHEIAEQGNLICECGNRDVGLTLLADKILLRCKKCTGETMIRAASNEDLKVILRTQQIFLGKLQDTI